ncbi:camk camkl gin4 protein kinase [Moniliophthora roreri MCA 2997]|uniref:Camk camkl gin4 protein kinase n=1 Tax=Moniliophthora roreri (strain MCA 2997) TaxID=1381753 RepID=V2WLR4_MONRO|nr:camk camkl gin4 protein kinase [Moniliophthora roreri MCA 2997]
MSSSVSSSPPRAPPIKYSTPLGTRWDKEKAAAGGSHAFDFPSDPKFIGPWIIGECVGKGASGRVKIAKHRITGQLAAVKILPLAPLVNSRAELVDPAQLAKSEKQRLGIDREITMMKLMNHPNILRIYDVYEGAKELFLVLEYVEGGELFDLLVNKGRLPPADAQAFFKQIIHGLNYAHTFSIIHRDLKPENILIASLNPPLIKIADWGMAAFAPPSLQLETSCGSPHYASPEIVNGDKYQGNATDIWSCGVILFALLTGRLPFDDKNVKALLAKVKSGKYDMPAYIDPQAKDLLSRMLVVDSSMRITIPEILRHPWLLKPLSKHASRSQAVDTSTTLSVPPTPPLPPSPSTLGRPIPSASLIDPDLFASLRVIWGRHTDTSGDNIKRDLLAPPGEGVHAKAFYFLLGKFKQEAEKESLGSGLGESLTFNLGWELDYGEVDMAQVSSHEGSAFGRYKGNSAVMRKAYSEQSRYTHSHATTQLPMVSGLAPPEMSRTSGTTASSSRGTSSSTAIPSRPLGPRGPSSVPARKSSFGVSPMPPVPRRGYTYSGPSIVREDKDRGVRNHLEANTNTAEGVSSVQFPRHPIQRAKTYRPRSRSGEDTEDMYTRLTMTRDRERRGERRVVSGKTVSLAGVTSNVDNFSTTAASHPEAGVATERERRIVSPTPVRASTLPSPNPRSAASQVKDNSPPHPVPELVSIKDSTRSRAVSLVPNDRSCKENTGGRPVLGDANANTGIGVTVAGKGKKGKLRPPPLEFPFPPLNRKRSTIADMNGNVLGSSTPAALSPLLHPLAHNVNHLPKSYLTSPKSYSTSKSPLISPKFPHFPQLPQTEFKGWLSNLFGGWRSSSSSGNWGDGILYSVHDVKRTTSDVVCLLEGIGINVIVETISGGGPGEELMVLKSGYRMDDSTASTASPTSPTSTAATSNLGESTNVGTAANHGDVLGHLNMKPLKFRVEIFTSLPSSQSPRDIASPTMLSPPVSPLFSPIASPRFSCDGTSYFPPTQGPRVRSTTSPLPSPKVITGNKVAAACDGVTTILLRLDKGSSATFKAIGKKLRDVYSDTPPSPGWVVAPGESMGHGDAEPIGVAV